MSSGANANGTAQNMGSSHKQKQMGARAEGGSKTGKNITASEKHRLATSGGSTGVSVSGGHYRSRTSVYSYNEEPNVIVRRHGHDHVIYGENEPSVTISKSKRRHYYGTALPRMAIATAPSTAQAAAPRSASPRVRASPAPRHGSAAPALSANPAPQRAETLPMAQDSRAAPWPKATR